MTRVYNLNSREFARKFREIEMRRPAAVERGIVSAALLGAELLAARAPKDLGILKRSARAVPQSPGAYIVLDAPHAGIVERGARPHWAPIGPLLAWAKRHTGPADAYRLAKAVQAKIARVGQRPTYFVRRSLPELRKILKAEVERELQLEDGRQV